MTRIFAKKTSLLHKLSIMFFAAFFFWQPCIKPMAAATSSLAPIIEKCTEVALAYFVAQQHDHTDTFCAAEKETFTVPSNDIITISPDVNKQQEQRAIIEEALQKRFPPIPLITPACSASQAALPIISSDLSQVSITLPKTHPVAAERQSSLSKEHSLFVLTPLDYYLNHSGAIPTPLVEHIRQKYRVREQQEKPEHLSPQGNILWSNGSLSLSIRPHSFDNDDPYLDAIERLQRIARAELAKAQEEQALRLLNEDWAELKTYAQQCQFTQACQFCEQGHSDEQKQWRRSLLQALFTPEGVVWTYTHDPLWRNLQQYPELKQAYINNQKILTNGKTALATLNHMLQMRYLQTLRMGYVHLLGRELPCSDAEEQIFRQWIPLIESRLITQNDAQTTLYRLIDHGVTPIAQHRVLLSELQQIRRLITAGRLPAPDWYDIYDFFPGGVLKHFTSERAQNLRKLYVGKFQQRQPSGIIHIGFNMAYIGLGNDLLFLENHSTEFWQKELLNKAFTALTQSYQATSAAQQRQSFFEANKINMELFKSLYLKQAPEPYTPVPKINNPSSLTKMLEKLANTQTCILAHLSELLPHTDQRYAKSKIEQSLQLLTKCITSSKNRGIPFCKQFLSTLLDSLNNTDNQKFVHAGILALPPASNDANSVTGNLILSQDPLEEKYFAFTHGICQALQGDHDYQRMILSHTEPVLLAFQLLLPSVEDDTRNAEMRFKYHQHLYTKNKNYFHTPTCPGPWVLSFDEMFPLDGLRKRYGNTVACQEVEQLCTTIIKKEKQLLAENAFQPTNTFQEFIVNHNRALMALAAQKANEKEEQLSEVSSSVAAGSLPPDPDDPRWKNIDPSVSNIEKLKAAGKLFFETLGSTNENGPIDRLLRCGMRGSDAGQLGTARGAAYELEKAFDLAQTGKKITAFGQRLIGVLENGESIAAEFDIITEEELIECKNVDWSRYDWNQFKQQIGKQLKIANIRQKIFRLYSKTPIPQELKEWLTNKGIQFFEG